MRLVQNEVINPEIKPEETKAAEQQNVVKILKNVVIVHNSDHVGSGTIRAIWPFNYLASVFAKPGTLIPIITQMFTRQSDILVRAKTLWFQRNMSPEHLTVIKEYRRLQDRLRYRMVYDLDDMLWGKNEEWGGDKEHGIPSYNFASDKVTDEMRDCARECMDYVDLITCSTEFLKTYLIEKLNVRTPITVIPNSVPKYMYGGKFDRIPVTEDIIKPRVLYNGSPTHYSNIKKKKGDLDNAWCDWVLESVKEDKIEFTVMGGLPWFWEEIKDKIRVVEWLPSFLYPTAMKQINAHFIMSPLTFNDFNQAKSDIKTIEAYASGIVAVGTVFSNGQSSPYDGNIVKVMDNCSVDDIQAVFDKYCQKDLFNETVSEQYRVMEETGRYTESAKFINLLTSTI